VLVDTESSNNMMYLPLDKLMNRDGRSAGSSSSQGQGGSSGTDQSIGSLTDQVIQEIRTRQDNTGVRRGR
jgi:membrane protease subunit HflK